MYAAPGLCGSMCDQLLERNSRPRLAVRAGRIDRDPADDSGIVALAFGKPKHDVEELFALDHLRERPAADGDLHDGLDVRHVDPVAGALVAVDLDLEVGLADDVEQPRVVDARAPCCRMLITRWPARSRTSRSLPKSLIELAPLTPESASSTLSRINCEKLMLTDGKSLNFSISSSWISSRVILRVQTSWPRIMTGFSRHCSIGVKGALNSRLK